MRQEGESKEEIKVWQDPACHTLSNMRLRLLRAPVERDSDNQEASYSQQRQVSRLRNRGEVKGPRVGKVHGLSSGNRCQDWLVESSRNRLRKRAREIVYRVGAAIQVARRANRVEACRKRGVRETPGVLEIEVRQPQRVPG